MWTTPERLEDWLTEISFLSKSPEFQTRVEQIATALVRDINIHNVYGWRESARTLAGGSRIYPYLRELNRGSIGKEISAQIREVSNRLSLIPEKISKNLYSQVDYARAQGATEKGCFNIARRSFVAGVTAKVKMMAQTVPHSVNSELTEARSEDLSIDCFIWNTLKDSHVRHSHAKMEGVVVFWNDLPSPEALTGMSANLGYYAPGRCPGCRCNPTPVLSIDDLFTNENSRVKVYFNGSISQLTRYQFLSLID